MHVAHAIRRFVRPQSNGHGIFLKLTQLRGVSAPLTGLQSTNGIRREQGMPRHRSVAAPIEFHTVGDARINLKKPGSKSGHDIHVFSDTPPVSRDIWVNDCAAEAGMGHSTTAGIKKVPADINALIAQGLNTLRGVTVQKVKVASEPRHAVPRSELRLDHLEEAEEGVRLVDVPQAPALPHERKSFANVVVLDNW
jgi:hypothetical protein